MEKQRGSILIIALVMVTFLAALATALLNPVSASRDITEVMYSMKHATIAAHSAAERVRYVMCMDGAVAQDGTSLCVLNAIADGTWTPVSIEDNGGNDEAGITFPSIDMKDANGSYIFDTAVNDTSFPQMQNTGDNDIRYIAYTTEDGNGYAVSYVSAMCNGQVRNMRVSYHRELATDYPHPSYLHAVYAANNLNSQYTFLMQNFNDVLVTTDRWLVLRRRLLAHSNLSSRGCLNVKKDETKGYLGFPIPNTHIKDGTAPRLWMYVQNVPANKTVRVNVHELSGPLGNGFHDRSEFGYIIGQIEIDGKDVKNEYVPFDLDPDVFNANAGDVLHLTFSFDEITDNGGNRGKPQSTIHFRCKHSTPPALKFKTEESRDYGQDEITGDIFIHGNAETDNGIVDGDTKATGTVTGDGTGEELAGVDEIPPPDLTRDGEWYENLQLNGSGTESSNPDVVTDSSDGSIDSRIAGIICPHTQTGENQDYMDDDATSSVTYVIDSNFGQMAGSSDPTYHRNTDSVIVTVPDEYNNKAIYIPGDFWCDILDPTFIDFKSESGNPVNLTFIVEGNVYLTDGVNRKRHPDSVQGGLISFISLKNSSGQGGNIYYGDPSSGGGRLDPVKAFLYAENDFKWYQKAQNAGDFDIIGNMTAGNIVDFTDRKGNEEFVPINVDFDPTILDDEVRENLPCLPKSHVTDIIPGTPYSAGTLQYL